LNKPASRKTWVTVLRLLGSLLTLGLVLRLIAQQGWEEIFEGVRRVGPRSFLLGLGLIMISRFAVVARWYVLLRSSSRSVSYWEAARLTFAGMFASNFLPTTIGGDILRLAAAKQLRMDRATCAASLIVDRLIGMTAMALVLPLGLPLLLRQGLSMQTPGLVWLSGPAALGVVESASAWRRFRDRLRRFLARFWEALKIWTRQPASLAGAMGLSLFHMTLLFSTIRMLLDTLGETVSLWHVAGMWSLIYFVTLIPISINGLGVQEVSLTYVFSHFGGISMQAALTLALLIRTLFWIASLPGSFFLPALLNLRKQEAQGASSE